MDYKSKRWQAKRESILLRDKCRCRECQRYGVFTNACVVHHAYPVEDFPAYAWEDWNLISLCLGCHNGMHDRETGALTAKGLAWRRRVAPPSLQRDLSQLGRPGGRDISDGGKNGRGGNSAAVRILAGDAPANDAPA